ncbi:MAG: RIP metalloprotease RseP [Acidobacteriota bacterium]|nr:RIP metalloprotease RseP [Acidobacteriota bacterium]
MIISILAFLFVLGIVVFVHELGHFLAARRIGVRVITFSLGFGPKLLKVQRGDTEYAISAIPLGGYVKMAGEQPDDARTGESDEFLSKSKWQRFQVLVAGPIMNIILAIVVLAAVLYRETPVPVYTEAQPFVGAVAENSPAARAGIQRGDRIARIGGVDVGTWDQALMEILPKANRELTMTLDRGGRLVDITITPDSFSKYELGEIGVAPRVRTQVSLVTPGGAAERAGIRARDIFVAIDGNTDIEGAKLVERIKASAGREIEIQFERDGRREAVRLVPDGDAGQGRIGTGLEAETRIMHPGFFEAIGLSFERNWESSKMIVKTLAGLFTRETPVRQLMGPVAIGEMSGTMAQLGWLPLFNFMAMISLNLGLLNLMPIPVLDGGHILILGLEGLARRDFSMKVKEKILFAGFAAVLMLMVTVIYNDLTRVEWIERFMFWR